VSAWLLVPPLALALALAPPGPALARARAPKARLEALRRAIEEFRQRVGAYEKRERGLLETLESMDRAAEALRADAAAARRKGAEARETLRRVEVRRRGVEVRLARTRRALAARAVALYEEGDVGPVEVLFSAGSVQEALARIELLQRLVERDQQLVERFRAEAAELAATRHKASRALAARAAAAARLERRRGELARERAAKRSLLVSVRSDRARARAALNELSAAARALEATLRGLSSRRRWSSTGGSFAALRGRLPSPVDAPLLAGFGKVVDEEFRTEVLRKGVEFAVRPGQLVRAVAGGEVRYAGWFRGYGKMVILDHGDGYFTVSAHLERIDVAVGAVVSAGDPIGTAGETGSLRGPRLHFEIRRGGKALDPAGWLEARPRG